MDMEKPKRYKEAEIDYILTSIPDIVMYLTIIDQVNVESDQKMVLSNIKLEREEHRNSLCPKTCNRDSIIGHGSSATICEEWDSNRQRPFKQWDIEETRRHHIEDTCEEHTKCVSESDNLQEA